MTRSMLLVGALFVLVPSVFAVGAAIMSTEAPYGMGNAAQYQAEVDAAKAVTPLPPGATWPAYLDRPSDPNASYGVGLGREMVEFNAYCLWLGAWYEAELGGAEAIAAAARATLDRMPSWRTFSDPLTSDHGLRDHFRAVIGAVDSGDVATVRNELEVNCPGTWPPGG